MKPSERYKAIEQAKADKQKFLADLAKNKQLAEMRQQELNHNYQMHKEGMALKNKELMQNLHTNYFNISSGAVKGVADNTKGDTTKENLYASIADGFSENNMGFLGKAFFKGLAIKERGQRETKESEEKRKVYEDYLNKYGDVIQYLSATNKYAQDLMARQQVKDQAEQEIRGVIDEVGKKNLTEGQSQAAIAQAANNASKKLGEPVIFSGIRQGDGAIIFQDEKGQTVFVENPYYLGQLERQNQNQANVRPNQLDLPNTTPIRFGNRQQQQQSQEPMPQQQQMPNEHQQQQQRQEDPNLYDNMGLSPNTAYTLPAEGGGTVTLTTDDEGNFGKGFESIREDVYTKLYEKGHIPDPKEVPSGAISHITKMLGEATKEIPKSISRMEAIDKLIEDSQNNSLQGYPKTIAKMLSWVTPQGREKLMTSEGLNIVALMEPLRELMTGNWTNKDFDEMMKGAWSIEQPIEAVKYLLGFIKKKNIDNMMTYEMNFKNGAVLNLPSYREQAKEFAPIFEKFNKLRKDQSMSQNNTQGQGVASGDGPVQEINNGNATIFSWE